MHGTHLIDVDALVHSTLLAIGGLLWIISYVLIIRLCFRDRTFGLPMFAICLNITWEFVFTIECAVLPNSMGLCPLEPSLMSTVGKGVDVFWFALDTLLLYQLIRFGRPFMQYAHLKKHFHAYVVAGVGFALMLHYGYVTYYDDVFGIVDGWIINLIMSVSFIFLAFQRPDLRGLSWPAAWTKMAANLFYAVGLTVIYVQDAAAHNLPEDGELFMYVMFGVTFFCDVVYIYHIGARRSPMAHQRPGVAAA
jgi:hypothetical protein